MRTTTLSALLLSLSLMLAACSAKQRVITTSSIKAERIASYDSLSLLIEYLNLPTPNLFVTPKSTPDTNSTAKKPVAIRITGAFHHNSTTQTEEKDTAQTKALPQQVQSVFDCSRYIIIVIMIFFLVFVLRYKS